MDDLRFRSMDEEMLRKWASKMPIPTVLSLCETEKYLHSTLCTDEIFWQYIAERDFPGMLPAVGQSWLDLVKIHFTNKLISYYRGPYSPPKPPLGYLQINRYQTLEELGELADLTVGALHFGMNIIHGSTLEQLRYIDMSYGWDHFQLIIATKEGNEIVYFEKIGYSLSYWPKFQVSKISIRYDPQKLLWQINQLNVNPNDNLYTLLVGLKLPNV